MASLAWLVSQRNVQMDRSVIVFVTRQPGFLLCAPLCGHFPWGSCTTTIEKQCRMIGLDGLILQTLLVLKVEPTKAWADSLHHAHMHAIAIVFYMAWNRVLCVCVRWALDAHNRINTHIRMTSVCLMHSMAVLAFYDCIETFLHAYSGCWHTYWYALPNVPAFNMCRRYETVSTPFYSVQASLPFPATPSIMYR